MKGYKTLTNQELDLASSFERWQQNKYGNILVPIFDPIEIPDPIPTDETDQRLAQDVKEQYT